MTSHASSAEASELMPGKFSARFARVFDWYGRRLIGRRFHAVRLANGGSELVRSCVDLPGLVVMAMNHSSWWDPMIGFYLHGAFMPNRTPCTPMDSMQLRKFKFFRRLGVFGVQPDNPASLRAMAAYVAERRRCDRAPLFMVTPQGRFVDPRLPIELRPGVGLVCSQSAGVRVICAAVEYAFWNDQRPEVFLRAVEVPAPDTAPSGGAAPNAREWTRAIEETMQRNARALAELVQARCPAAFETLLGGGRARINPVYDALLRLTGRSTAVSADHRSAAEGAAAGVRP